MIAQRLKYYRTIQNITQRELAESAGVLKGVVGQLESRDSDVYLSTAIKLKDALDLDTVEELMIPISEEERKRRRDVLINRRVNKIIKKRERNREYKKRKKREARICHQ